MQERHPDLNLKFRNVITSDGQLKYQTKLIEGCIPETLKIQGRLLQADDASETISVLSHVKHNK